MSTATDLPLSAALERYFAEHSALHHRPATASKMRAVMRDFLEKVGPDLPLGKLARRQIVAWQAKSLESRKPVSVNFDLARVRGFLNWCMSERLIEWNPCTGVPRIKIPKRLKRTPTADEVARALAALVKYRRLHDLVLTAANTGLRSGELLHVRGIDFSETERKLRICAWGDWQPKDAEDRTINLESTAAGALLRRKRELGSPEYPLFGTPAGKVRDRTNVRDMLVNAMPLDLKWLGLHAMRRYFATSAAKAGWPTEKLQKYLGHSDFRTTLAYYVDLKADEIGAPPRTAKPAKGSRGQQSFEQYVAFVAEGRSALYSYRGAGAEAYRKLRPRMGKARHSGIVTALKAGKYRRAWRLFYVAARTMAELIPANQHRAFLEGFLHEFETAGGSAE